MAFNCHFHSLKNKWAFNNRDTLKMIDVNLQKVWKRRKQCHLVYVCLLLLFQVYFWDTSKSILNNSVKKYIYFLYLSVHLKTFFILIFVIIQNVKYFKYFSKEYIFIQYTCRSISLYILKYAKKVLTSFFSISLLCIFAKLLLHHSHKSILV